jgi:glycosyltransferase involved in cell wall biosynthesis
LIGVEGLPFIPLATDLHMRIGIDATAIPANRAGAGNYIFSLVAGLASVDAENEYFVFAKPDHIAEWGIDQDNFHFLPSAGRYRAVRLAWEQCILPMLVRRHHIDVLHSPHYTMPIFGPCRKVVTFCDMIFLLYPEVHTLSKRAFFRTMMPISARRAQAIIAISESTARDVVQLLRVPPDRVHAIPLAAAGNFLPIDDPTSVDSVCSRYGLRTGEFVLFVGVMEPRKNIPVLLHAYRKLVDRGVSKQLAIVGKRGWMCDDVLSTVQTLDLEKRVVFTGYVPSRDLPYLYNGACLFIYPSLYEGFGLPVLEAMACGTPVVTSNVSSMPEIVGDSALLVDPRNSEEIAQAMEKLLADDILSHAMRESALKRAAMYSWDRTARETLQVYLEVGQVRR